MFADAKHRPQGAIGEVEGVGNATTGSITDKLTREHRMTLDEAHLILNAKRGEAVERILQVRPSGLCPWVLRANFLCDQNYEHLFKANALAEAPPTNAPGGRGAAVIPRHSHYLQSKVVRARERIEAELEMAREEEPPATAS